MAFDWKAFLRRHNIPYTTTGPNASRGRVNIKCPWCGAADPSEHLGISLRHGGYSCWRNPRGHSGSHPENLIVQLVRCSFAEAQQLVHGEKVMPLGDDLTEYARQSGEFEIKEQRPTRLDMPKDFRSITNGSVMAIPFLTYLREKRHYRSKQIEWLADTYDLRYSVKGRFNRRIIIPIYDRRNKLLTWQGRTIDDDDPDRYLALSNKTQLCAPKETLLGLPLLWTCANPRVLLVVEGAFDAMWITLFGQHFGVYATCLFGLSLQSQQLELLDQLRSRFQYMGLMLDREEATAAFQIANFGAELGVVDFPTEDKDPAEMPPQAVIDLCTKLVSGTQGWS